MYICTHRDTYICMHVYVYIYTYTLTQTHTHVCVCIWCIWICIHLYTHVLKLLQYSVKIIQSYNTQTRKACLRHPNTEPHLLGQNALDSVLPSSRGINICLSQISKEFKIGIKEHPRKNPANPGQTWALCWAGRVLAGSRLQSDCRNTFRWDEQDCKWLKGSFGLGGKMNKDLKAEATGTGSQLTSE